MTKLGQYTRSSCIQREGGSEYDTAAQKVRKRRLYSCRAGGYAGHSEILFAIAVPSLLGCIHLSQFRKNESYAKTMYLSAESELTYLRTGGEWESFCSKVKKEGALNQSFDESDEDRKKLVGRIYGIRLDAGEYAEGELSGDGALVGALLSQDTYDKSVLNAAICIEIDVESGQVYSVFYGTNCKGLYYGSNEDSKPADK